MSTKKTIVGANAQRINNALLERLTVTADELLQNIDADTLTSLGVPAPISEALELVLSSLQNYDTAYTRPMADQQNRKIQAFDNLSSISDAAGGPAAVDSEDSDLHQRLAERFGKATIRYFLSSPMFQIADSFGSRRQAQPAIPVDLYSRAIIVRSVIGEDGSQVCVHQQRQQAYASFSALAREFDVAYMGERKAFAEGLSAFPAESSYATLLTQEHAYQTTQLHARDTARMVAAAMLQLAATVGNGGRELVVAALDEHMSSCSLDNPLTDSQKAQALVRRTNLRQGTYTTYK